MKIPSSMFLLIGLLAPSTAIGRVWYVKPDSTGDAPTIQAAMDSAIAGDEVLLAPGTYSRANQGDDGQPLGSNMLVIKGGVRLRGEAGAEVTILDGRPIPPFEGGRVILIRDAGEVVIEDLTISHGYIFSSGAGIAAYFEAFPIIRNCIFRDNRTGNVGSGAGVACYRGRIETCMFEDNRAGVESSGGAISCGPAVITGCMFRGNSARSHGGTSGGAIRSTGALISDCVFERNAIGGDHGGVSGGALSDHGGLVLQRCLFIGNWAGGRGAYSFGGAVAIEGTARITECVFVDNYAEQGVGAAASSTGLADVTIERCTFIDNTNAIRANTGAVRSSIIIGSRDQICAASFAVSCSNFIPTQAGEVCGTDGGGNFSADPQFCATDPAMSRNFLLQSDSPCAPGSHPDGADCGIIGASPVGCESVATEPVSWSAFKHLFR